jgi:hypothetical protein
MENKLSTSQMTNIIAEMGNVHGFSIKFNNENEAVDEMTDISYEKFIMQTEEMFKKVKLLLETGKLQ